jgi:two-component system chemotaxis response regulator CheB
MIAVLVVDDSAFMRLALRRIIEAEGDLKVAGEVADGAAALDAVVRLKPQVVVMDVEMPGMDGLEATRRIMALADPPAVMMVSHHTSAGSTVALAALEAGAVDYLCKESGLGGLDLGGLDKALRGRLRHWAMARASQPARPAALPRAATPQLRPASSQQRPAEVVVVGASTGGPDALAAFLAATGQLPVPMVIAQHMPAGLEGDFARHLAQGGRLPVRIAEPGRVLAAGEATLLPGGTDGTLLREAAGFTIRLARTAAPVHPSVDLLFRSAALVARHAVGVVLTGMGRDGTEGGEAMVQRDMALLAQSPESCVVAGMPGALIAAGLAEATGDPAALGRQVARMLAGVVGA